MRRITRAGVLAHRDFRLLWAGSSASVVGDRIVTVALALFVVQLTGSATDVGIVLAAQVVPLMLCLLIGGVIADRLPRHRVVLGTDLVRFALHALLGALILAGGIRLWEVVAIEVAFGAAEGFFRPAATALVPETVPEEGIQSASALIQGSRNIAEFAGPALATVLVLGVNAGAAFLVDAATFLVSAACVAFMRPRSRGAGAPEEAERGMWRELRAGFDEVRSRGWIVAILGAFAVAIFAALAPWTVLGPLVGREQYGDLAVFGVVAATFGAGTALGSFAGLSWRPRYPLRVGILLAALWPLSTAAFATGAALPLVVVASVLGGGGIALFEVWWATALAQRVPPHALARVTSYDWTVSAALVPAGYLLAGPLATALGAVPVLLTGSLIGCGAIMLALVSRELRELPRLPATGVAPVSAGQ
jgi:predicted MFS family arabinose efflux permease